MLEYRVCNFSGLELVIWSFELLILLYIPFQGKRLGKICWENRIPSITFWPQHFYMDLLFIFLYIIPLFAEFGVEFLSRWRFGNKLRLSPTSRLITPAITENHLTNNCKITLHGYAWCMMAQKVCHLWRFVRQNCFVKTQQKKIPPWRPSSSRPKTLIDCITRLQQAGQRQTMQFLYVHMNRNNLSYLSSPSQQ